ncbi:hypothetical protein [Peribacillus kribbensis]|uniref:hypothetical protein n=1 Tax=Peribacillus kribbensis TaxID=356658 RepID=UPI0012DC0C1F|nr:hypothetical protein [Peribacillus kribbensis]
MSSYQTADKRGENRVFPAVFLPFIAVTRNTELLSKLVLARLRDLPAAGRRSL